MKKVKTVQMVAKIKMRTVTSGKPLDHIGDDTGENNGLKNERKFLGEDLIVTIKSEKSVAQNGNKNRRERIAGFSNVRKKLVKE